MMGERTQLRGAHDITPFEEGVIVGQARQMRLKLGLGWGTLAHHFGVEYYWLRWRCDPPFRKRKIARHRAHESGRAFKHGPFVELPIQRPPDSRDLTGRMLGDPIYQRSALYEKRGVR